MQCNLFLFATKLGAIFSKIPLISLKVFGMAWSIRLFARNESLFFRIPRPLVIPPNKIYLMMVSPMLDVAIAIQDCVVDIITAPEPNISAADKIIFFIIFLITWTDKFCAKFVLVFILLNK